MDQISSKMRTKQFVAYTGLSESLAKRLRRDGDGPAFSRIRRLVLYDKDDVDRWIAERLQITSNVK